MKNQIVAVVAGVFWIGLASAHSGQTDCRKIIQEAHENKAKSIDAACDGLDRKTIENEFRNLFSKRRTKCFNALRGAEQLGNLNLAFDFIDRKITDEAGLGKTVNFIRYLGNPSQYSYRSPCPHRYMTNSELVNAESVSYAIANWAKTENSCRELVVVFGNDADIDLRGKLFSGTTNYGHQRALEKGCH